MSSQEEFARTFRNLMLFRRRSANLSRALYCSRMTVEIEAIHGERLLTSVAKMSRDERSAVLAWLGKAGPFIDDERTEVEADLYHLFGTEVTDLGPGEAARQKQLGHDARLLSFIHRRDIDFSVTRLPVIHGFPDEPLAEIAVANIASLAEAKSVADSIDPEPKNWRDLLNVSRRLFEGLLIGEHCDHVLEPLTFYPVVARRTLELLNVLNTVVTCTSEQGALNERGMELLQNHFVGQKAWFTDESEENKRLFGNAMTFPDPAAPEHRLQCFWHGKIKTPQFRIHFVWPREAGIETLKIVYIGPKISKK